VRARDASALAALAAALTVMPAASGATAQPAMRNYEVRLIGTVRRIDRPHRLVTVAYAPLETAPGGVRPVLVADRHALALLSVGDAIAGIADTRHSPWPVRDVHVIH
jgi:hypothetical protein